MNAFKSPPLLQKTCCRCGEHFVAGNHRCICQSLFQPTVEFALFQVGNRSKLFNHSLLDGALTTVIFHDANEQQWNGSNQAYIKDELCLNALENVFIIIHKNNNNKTTYPLSTFDQGSYQNPFRTMP